MKKRTGIYSNIGASSHGDLSNLSWALMFRQTHRKIPHRNLRQGDQCHVISDHRLTKSKKLTATVAIM